MAHITDNIGPAFRYECHAKFAFENCSKYGDPWYYAVQDVYSNFTSGIEF